MVGLRQSLPLQELPVVPLQGGGHRRTAMTSQSAPLSPPAGRARCATDRVQVCHRANGHPARRTEPFRNASCADGEAKTDCCSMLHR